MAKLLLHHEIYIALVYSKHKQTYTCRHTHSALIGILFSVLAYLFYQYVLPHFNRVIKSVTNAWQAAALSPFLCLERKTPVLGNERANSSCVSELVPHHKVQVRNVGENVLSLRLISLLARLHFCWVLHDNLNFAQSLYTFQRALFEHHDTSIVHSQQNRRSNVKLMGCFVNTVR